MFYPMLMTDEEKSIQKEVREFVRDEVPHDLVRALDHDEIRYPREFVEKLAAHHLLGLRFDPKWGGRRVVTVTIEITHKRFIVLKQTRQFNSRGFDHTVSW